MSIWRPVCDTYGVIKHAQKFSFTHVDELQLNRACLAQIELSKKQKVAPARMVLTFEHARQTEC